MKKSTLCAITLAALPGFASADTLFGLYAGVGSWQSEFSGNLNTSADSTIDLEGDLGFDNDANNIMWVAIELPIPVVPNIKLKSTSLEVSGDIATGIIFNGVSLSAGSSDLNLSHTDATVYYEILDNWISIDLGFTVRIFDGEVSLAGADPLPIDAPLPLGYAMAKFELPFSGFYGGAEINAIGFGDSGVTDITVKIGYESAFRVGAELGYRTLNITLEDEDDLNTNIDVGGIYFAATLHI